jgi:3-hydroxyisobutyrate dehydrogenase-like beta-hydroxyacid dehydrogenase
VRRRVHGNDLDPDRVREWSAATNSSAGCDLAAVDWPAVDTVPIAVPTADQVSSVSESLQEHAARPLTVLVHTTLAPGDARRVFSSAPGSWRAFEVPVSGGPQGARRGSMTTFVAGPAPTEEEELLAAISGRIFRIQSYGQPALVKLLNNALATYDMPSQRA